MRDFQDRIDRAQRTAQRQAGQAVDPTWYRLRVSPSCPPSTTVRIRGGLVYNMRNYESHWRNYWPHGQRAYTVPDLSVDVSTYTRYELGNYPVFDPVEEHVVFNTPGYYKCYVLLLNLPLTAENPAVGDWSCQLWGTESEMATTAEAEAYMEWDTMVESAPWGDWDTDPGYHGFPLCGLILRNDGTVGTGHILPVDRVNRGRSYMWPGDVRPLWMFNR